MGPNPPCRSRYRCLLLIWDPLLSYLLKNCKPSKTKPAFKIILTFLKSERETETCACLKSGSVKAKGNFASVEMELIQMQNANVGKKWVQGALGRAKYEITFERLN